jgi:DNA-binding FrmR family transcriptional regulator
MDGLDRDAVTTRLRRIEGQVRGVERMVGEERNCEDVLTQLMAVRSGLEQVWVMLVDAHIRDCLLSGAAIPPARLEEISQTLKLWTRFGAPATQLPD